MGIQNFEFQYFKAYFSVFQKNEYFVDIFGIGLVLGVISIYFMVFSEGKCKEWGYFYLFIFFWGGGGGANISNIFGCLIFLIIFWVDNRCCMGKK